MGEDIFAGLKNAVERGYSIDKAVQSFINAGYNPVEVKRAAEKLQGASGIVKPQIEDVKTQMRVQSAQSMQKESKTIEAQNPQIQQPIAMQFQQKPKKHTGIIIILIIILVLLIAGLAYLIFFEEEFLSTLFG